MKHLIIIFLSLFAFVVSAEAQDYMIYKFEGAVQIMAKGTTTWSPAKKRMVVNSSCKIRVPKGGSIEFSETTSGRIISSPKAGEYTIREIVSSDKKKAESIFSSLNKKLAKDIKSESDKNSHYVTYGATTRGLSDDVEYSDSLYSSIYHYIKTTESIENSDVQLKKVSDSEDLFHFEISNNSGVTRFVNVLKYQEGICAYCFDFNYDGFNQLPITNGKTADLSNVHFLQDESSARYILIATPRPYKLGDLLYLLSKGQKPEYDTPAPHVLIAE